MTHLCTLQNRYPHPYLYSKLMWTHRMHGWIFFKPRAFWVRWRTFVLTFLVNRCWFVCRVCGWIWYSSRFWYYTIYGVFSLPVITYIFSGWVIRVVLVKASLGRVVQSLKKGEEKNRNLQFKTIIIKKYKPLWVHILLVAYIFLCFFTNNNVLLYGEKLELKKNLNSFVLI